MKNITAISGAQDIINFVNQQWCTEMFRSYAEKEGSELNLLLKAFASKPRLFFNITDPELEKLHFTTWMGAMALRGEDWYDNPYIADLFLLHEICHMANAHYDFNLKFDNWQKKMVDEEVHASSISDVMVYFWMPELRRRTFDHPIWADKFLSGQGRASYQEDPARCLKFIKEMYICQMEPENQSSDNPGARRIAQHGVSNYVWSNIWKDRYRDVEFQMYLFGCHAARNREFALTDHMRWLEAQKAEGDHLPFRAEAEAYAEHLKKVYGA